MRVSKRIITFFLALAMLFSLFMFASASASSGILVDSTSVTAWNSLLSSNVKTGSIAADAQSAYWSQINTVMSKYGVGDLSSYDKVVQVTSRLDSSGSGVFGALAELLSDSFTSLWDTPDYIVMYDSSFGVYRPYDNDAHIWVVNSMGHFPYYDPDPDDSSSSETSEAERTGQWVNMQKVGTQTVLWHIASNYELNEFKEQWADLYPNAKIMETTNYYWLVRSDRYTSYVLCDKYGYPYYLPKDGKTAITTPNNYYQDTTNQYLEENTTNNYYDYENNEYNEYDNSTNVNVMDGGSALVGSPIDINNGIINVGGELMYIDNLTYDASTQTYYVDAHDEYTYNTTTNNYTTNEYLYVYQYHIDYTSITYIGQTEEYDERYEMYYQLPDGRSSADLTAEDLEQLSFVFADVVQYARSADDVNMRVLYHFDGSTDDSSYWSYCTSFDWISGASLTYMDEGTFNGSLYLDETDHEFTITLPNATDVNKDFTLQFRYYQSYTAAPIADSYISFGSDIVFQMNGSQYLDGSGTVLSAVSVGSWNEICIMRKGGILCYYINGVCVYSTSSTNVFGNVIRFHFGSQQQTYKKLDELRFTRGAVYGVGQSYTPTSVPHDTNLSLILPDGERPVADEIMVFTPYAGNLFSASGLDDWTDSNIKSNLTLYTSSPGTVYETTFADGPKLFYNATYTSVSTESEFTSVSSRGTTPTVTTGSGLSSSDYCTTDLANGFFLPLGGQHESLVESCVNVFSNFYQSFGSIGSPYTLSVVFSDGMYSYITFSLMEEVDTYYIEVLDASNCSYLELAPVVYDSQTRFYSSLISGYLHYHFQYFGISAVPASGVTAEIIYMELVEGSSPRFSVDWEQAVYSSGELEDAPVLAVRTNQDITGYQIGGVRSSYPTKGLVYAMVENSRIVSLQQYSGSAWVEVDGRIWTGQRWIPYSSFDVFTLQDCYDIIGGSDDNYEYIYTESGFWAWFQKQWNKFMDKLDLIIEYITGEDSGSDCEHVYQTETQREPSCTAPGHMLYTCDNCGDSYTELIEPAGHDWIVQEHVAEVLDEGGNVVEEGYDILVCSVCELETKDYGDGPIENDLFDAIGDLLAEGIDWILDKLAQVADSLSGITDTFNSFVERVEGMTGEYSLMFGAFLALLPEDLRALMWLSIVAGVVGLVWKAWAK